MNTKKLVDYAALLHFAFYGVVFIIELLSKNKIPDNYIQFLIAALGLGFVALTTDRSYLVNCFAFSAIVSSLLLYVASLTAAVMSVELLMVFTGYFFICFGIAVVNMVRLKVFNSRANNQILSPAKNAGCDVNPRRGFPR